MGSDPIMAVTAQCMTAFSMRDHMGESMTPTEQQYIDKRFEDLEKLVKTVIDGLKEAFEKFVKSQDEKTKLQQAQISEVHGISNENRYKIKELEGRIETIEKVKEAEERTEEKIKGEVSQNKNTGMAKWKVIVAVIAICISAGLSILGIIF
jgi:septal ring factor EnvC (AmiA/AmiB activator)